nr:agamous-like MADS-box protein AGL9 homolog [Tanacetum cinerariifolium]
MKRNLFRGLIQECLPHLFDHTIIKVLSVELERYLQSVPEVTDAVVIPNMLKTLETYQKCNYGAPETNVSAREALVYIVVINSSDNGDDGALEFRECVRGLAKKDAFLGHVEAKHSGLVGKECAFGYRG